MATQTTNTPNRLRRATDTAQRMVTGQHMAAAHPSESDVRIAIRQAMGELTGDEAAAEAIAAARSQHHRP